MAYIPFQEVKFIWFETPDYSWNSLRRALEKHFSDEDEDIPEYDLDRMYKIARYYEFTDQPFPESFQELYEIINNTAL